MTPTVTQLMESNQLSLPRRDDCKTRKDTKYCLIILNKNITGAIEIMRVKICFYYSTKA